MAQILKKTYNLFFNNNRLQRIWILAKTDFKQRYYGSSLGLLWALINPLCQLVIYYSVFTLIFQGSVPNFALYIFSGLILWMFFTEATKKGIHVLNSKRYLLENIPINKFDIYLSSGISAFLGVLFNILIFFIVSIFFDIKYSYNLLFLPLILINLFIFVLSVTFFLSTIYIYIRDLDHIWDILLLAGLWTIPIIWDQAFVINKLQFLLYLHPLTGILINIREILLYDTFPDLFILFYDFVYSLLLFFTGLFFVNKFSHKALEMV
ncbi:ABC transporter permease [Candidatus Desantisbacteria bacterium]|nr:ABC transporter permease [Candidatus Desantisbacteria bacterium]